MFPPRRVILWGAFQATPADRGVVGMVVRYDEEQYFLDADGELNLDSNHKFPSLNDSSTLSLSVIVPAYNEEARITPMLNEALAYLETRRKRESNFTYEIIVVDDGSSDNTIEIALEKTKEYGVEKVRVLRLRHNRGKGGAVCLGVLGARGKEILFADADGATKFEDVAKLQQGLKGITSAKKDQRAVAVGSRAHLEKESIAQRSAFRTFLMYGFHFLVWLFCVRTVKDTQCGFKLFSRAAAQLLFPSLHVERWAFDVELLFLAEKLGVPIAEVQVNWHEIDGSKLVPVFSWLQMGLDLMKIWLWYFLGIWMVKERGS